MNSHCINHNATIHMSCFRALSAENRLSALDPSAHIMMAPGKQFVAGCKVQALCESVVGKKVTRKKYWKNATVQGIVDGPFLTPNSSSSVGQLDRCHDGIEPEIESWSARIYL